MGKLINYGMQVKVGGELPPVIKEFVGMKIDRCSDISIAKIVTESGWEDTGKTPEFKEFVIVDYGMLRIDTKTQSYQLKAGMGYVVNPGEWVRYSSPGENGSVFFSICTPSYTEEKANFDS
jgi:mannose-6-phosphate isomerase-like protein (cupin superfamily)